MAPALWSCSLALRKVLLWLRCCLIAWQRCARFLDPLCAFAWLQTLHKEIALLVSGVGIVFLHCQGNPDFQRPEHGVRRARCRGRSSAVLLSAGCASCPRFCRGSSSRCAGCCRRADRLPEPRRSRSELLGFGEMSSTFHLLWGLYLGITSGPFVCGAANLI